MKLCVYDQKGDLVELEDAAAPTLMRALRSAGLDVTAQCGGCAACGTCHVYVDEAWRAKVGPADENEMAMLDSVPERRENSRLSCQIKLNDGLNGLTVTLAPGSPFV